MILERVSNAGFRHFMRTITLRRTQLMCAASTAKNRGCSSHNVDQKDATTIKAPDFKTIYSFAYIQPARFLCRFKVYQTGIVVFLTGLSITTDTNVQFALTVCTVSLVMLSIMGEFFRKLVGFMYTDPTGEQIKIAHLTFWGNRKDVVLPISSIIPLCDTAENSSDVFFKLKFYDKKQSPFYLSLKFGRVVDEDMFHKVLGQMK